MPYEKTDDKVVLKHPKVRETIGVSDECSSCRVGRYSRDPLIRRDDHLLESIRQG